MKAERQLRGWGGGGAGPEKGALRLADPEPTL